MPKQLEKGEKIYPFPMSLKERQIDWIRDHKFNFNKFVRQQLDEYIKMKEELEEWKKEN